MLGKSRYYDNDLCQHWACCYVFLYKLSNSDKIYEVKIWREKPICEWMKHWQFTNLRKLLKEIKFKRSNFCWSVTALAQH
jgi:hypothetical protein